MSVTQEEVRSLFEYEHEGLWWKNPPRFHSNLLGVRAGNVHSTGYRRISIRGKGYLEHRLVWLYHHGYFPENGIDHINRDKTDNKIENLREASVSCNRRNIGNVVTNTSGVKGVAPNHHRRGKNWRVFICINSTNRHLGHHDTFEEAVLARLAAEQCLDWAGCESDSPAYLYYKENILNGNK